MEKASVAVNPINRKEPKRGEAELPERIVKPTQLGRKKKMLNLINSAKLLLGRSDHAVAPRTETRFWTESTSTKRR